jgi:putative transposase
MPGTHKDSSDFLNIPLDFLQNNNALIRQHQSMVRLSRLTLPDQTTWASLRPSTGLALVTDLPQRMTLLDAILQAVQTQAISLHAYGIGPTRLDLLVTPPHETALSLAMQSLGRRYVRAYNARHQRVGSLWAGRYTSTLVENGSYLLPLMQWIEQQAGAHADGQTPHNAAIAYSSKAHHWGDHRVPWISDPPEYWALGNTPFDRAHHYKSLYDEGLAPIVRQTIETQGCKGWPLGSPEFIKKLTAETGRAASPRKAGRPRKSSPQTGS